MSEGTKITYLEATDRDDANLVFNIVGDPTVLAAGPLLRIVNDASRPNRASVFLNSRLNAVVRRSSSLSYVLSLTESAHNCTSVSTAPRFRINRRHRSHVTVGQTDGRDAIRNAAS